MRATGCDAALLLISGADYHRYDGYTGYFISRIDECCTTGHRGRTLLDHADKKLKIQAGRHLIILNVTPRALVLIRICARDCAPRALSLSLSRSLSLSLFLRASRKRRS